jgi:CHAT domain-containing protein/tetratricopeptide (TPR) repeat protein
MRRDLAGRKSVVTILPLQTSPFSSIQSRAVSALLGVLMLSCTGARPPAPGPAAAPSAPAAVAKPKAPALTVGVPVERSLPPGAQDEITLDLEAGLYLRLALDGRGTELSASLLDPRGEAVAGDEDNAEGRLAWITKLEGTYRLAVTAPNAKIAGRYKVLLLALRRAVRPDDDQRLAADAALLAARREKDPARAVQQAEAALKLWSDLHEVDGELESLETLAARDKSRSLSWYERALVQAQASGRPSLEAQVRTDLGEALSRQYKFDRALPHLAAALPLWEIAGDSYQRTRALYYLGLGSDYRGKLDEAFQFFDQAQKLADPAWDLTPDIRNGLCSVYASRGESQKAFDCLDEAFKLARETGRKGAEAAVRTARGVLHLRRGEASAALGELAEALRINQSDPLFQPYIGNVQSNLGSVYLGLGQPQEALANFQRALGSFRRNENKPWTAISLVSVGRADLILGQPAEALKSFQEALEIAAEAKSPKTRANALQGIGVAELQLQQVPQAIQHLKEALEIQAGVDRPGQALTQQKLGEAFQKQGDPAAARAALLTALRINGEVEAPYSRPPILLALARLERGQGDLQEALRRIEEALKILESVRYDLTDDRLRTAFLASRRSYYDFYVDLLMGLDRQRPGQGYADQALAKSEMARARALLDLLTEARFELTRGISAELREKEKDVRARLSQIQRQIADELSKEPARPLVVRELEARRQETEREQEGVEARIKAESPLYFQLRYPSPLRREEIQRLLQPDEALLEYSLGEKGMYLFVVTAQGLAVHPLKPSLEKVGEDIEVLRAALENGGRLTNAYLRTAHRLYEELVEPAQAEIQGKRRLLIAPDGALHHLAFEALLTREARREPDCHFLIEDRAVSYVPSASVLSSLEAPAAGAGPRKRLIAFAPAYGPPSGPREATRGGSPAPPLPDLEGARQEVAAIAGLYSETDRTVYVGLEASRESFRHAPSAAFLHFAGHGRLDEDHPERSSLELTDGSLQVDDIFNLELSSDLVVLSACQTAGKVVTGEGLVGLTRAFLYAGTPSVVVSLWQAVDTSARDLMVQLYTNLGRQGDKAEALRQAKLALIAQGRQTGGRLARPYYWAPFILVGKPR